MLKSLNKKGFTLVEVLCSLAVFSVISICMMFFDVASLNMKKNIKTMDNNIIIMEALKNNIIYSMTYEELEKLKTDKKLYINKENMTFDKIKMGANDVFSVEQPTHDPYIKLTLSKPESELEPKVEPEIEPEIEPKHIPKLAPKVYKVTLSLYSSNHPKGTLMLQCSCYKGDYK